MEIKNIIDALENDASESIKRIVELDYNYVDYDTLNSIFNNRLYIVKGLIEFLKHPDFYTYNCDEISNRFLELVQAVLDTPVGSDFPTNLVNKITVIQEIIKNGFTIK